MAQAREERRDGWIGGGGRRRAPWLGLLAALLLAGTVLALQIRDSARAEYRLDYGDEYFYISIAHRLNTHGVFTRGVAVPPLAWDDAPDRPSMYMAPLYPAFLAGIAAASPTVADTFGCLTRQRRDCDLDGLLPVFWVQGAVTLLATLACYAALLALLESVPLALLATLLMLVNGIQAKWAAHCLTESLTYALFYIFLACFAVALRRPRRWLWLAAGVALGLTALTRPSYFYLPFLLAPPIAIWMRYGQGQGWPRALGAAALVPAAALAVELPWALRNLHHFGELALTGSYGGVILIQRLAYNAMTWQEWLTAFLFWGPVGADDWVSAHLPAELYQRLDIWYPGGYFNWANSVWLPQALAAAGGEPALLGYLIREHLLPDLGRHLLVSLPFAWRGLWFGSGFALIALVLLAPAVWSRFHGREGAIFLLFALPSLFMLALHAAVSLNETRYNEGFAIVYAAIMATVAGALWRWLRVRRQAVGLKDGGAR